MTKIIKLEEIPEIEIVIPDLNRTGCPVPCQDEGKYLRCYFGIHYLCPKLRGSAARYGLRSDDGI